MIDLFEQESAGCNASHMLSDWITIPDSLCDFPGRDQIGILPID